MMVGPYVRLTAAPGAGEEIAARWLDVACSQRDMSRLTAPPQRIDLMPSGGVGPGLD